MRRHRRARAVEEAQFCHGLRRLARSWDQGTCPRWCASCVRTCCSCRKRACRLRRSTGSGVWPHSETLTSTARRPCASRCTARSGYCTSTRMLATGSGCREDARTRWRSCSQRAVRNRCSKRRVARESRSRSNLRVRCGPSKCPQSRHSRHVTSACWLLRRRSARRWSPPT